MSLNRSLLTQITEDLKKKKKPSKPRVPRNQWQHPGEVTNIPSNNITMDGVSYPVLGVPNIGPAQMMYPDQQYNFPGAGNVTEYPMMQEGGDEAMRAAIMRGADTALAYGLKGAKWIGKNVFGTDDIIPDAAKNFFFNRIRPISYPTDLRQVHAEIFRTNPAKPTRDLQGDLSMDEEAWSRVLNRPTKSKYFIPSKFKPTSATDPSAQYYQMAPGVINEDLMKRVLTEHYFRQNGRKNSKGQTYVPMQTLEPFMSKEFMRNYKKYAQEEFEQTDPLANFQVYEGKDPKTGKRYLSISDVYDFGLQSANEIIKPMNIYHRVYKQGGVQTRDEREMVNGIADILTQVNDKSNREQIARQMMADFERENVTYNPEKFIEMSKLKNGGQHGGLDRWFAEKWVDIKTGKPCGRQEGESRAGYPACRPSKRINSDTPKTAGELSGAEKAKFKREKTSSDRIDYQHRRREDGGEELYNPMEEFKSGGNAPTNPALWSRAKSLARQKFDVYPSAYANGWAAKWYKGKGGGWRKAEFGGMFDEGGTPDNPGFNALPSYVQAKIIGNMAAGGEPQNAGFQALPEAVQQQIIDNMAFGGMIEDTDYSYMAEGGIPERYRNMGFTSVGTKKNSTRPGKKWMVLAKKGDDYKVVHGGYDGMKDYTQHGSEERRKRFWDRMGGKNSAKATDPFSPLYWHKRFGTWAEGGSTHSGNAWYQVGGEEDNTGWIKTILNYEAQHGSPTGKGLSDWGYHTRQPKTLDEAVGYFQQDYLPKVQNLPMGMRERAADFLYNTGEDARLYMLDQYVRKYENMPSGLADRGAYRAKGAKAGEFDGLYSKYQAKIDALPMEERIKLLDAGRDYYYRNINTVNGQPSAAYNATWKPRLGIFGNYQAPKSVAPVAQPAAQATAPVVQQQPVVQQPAAQTREPYKIQTAPSLSVQQKPITGNYTLPTLTALPGAPLVGPSAAQPTQTVPQPKIKSTDWVADTAAADAELQANFDLDQSVQKDNTQAAATAVASGLKTAVNKANPLLKIEKKKTFNSLMGDIQDKFMEQYTNPYSAMNVAGYAGNLIDGVNNQNAYNDELNRQRQNYSTDYAYQPTGNNDMSRGQYDMYGQMVPNKIGGNLSYTGMNQKYSSGVKRFQAGGISDFDYIADRVTPVFNNNPGSFENYNTVAPADATRVAQPVAAMPAGPISSDRDDIRNIIGTKESQNNYGALPKLKGGRLASSAVGKYQFLWDSHKEKIKAITGISSKEAFRLNPQAQEKFFDYWNNSILTPVANEIMSRFKPNMSMNDIKQIIHFQGPGGAKQFFRTGKYTTDAFGSNPMAYLKKKYAVGGEMEVTEDELAEILRNGGQVEYV